MAKGFFAEGSYQYSLDRENRKLLLKIPFRGGAAQLHNPAGTARTLENILASEFSLSYQVEIVEREGADEYLAAFEEEISAEYRRAIAECDAGSAAAPPAESDRSAPVKEPGKRVTTLLGSPAPAEKLSEGIFRLGNAVFDLSAPDPYLR